MEKLKELLMAPPVLSALLPEEELFLYLLVSERALSSTFIRRMRECTDLFTTSAMRYMNSCKNWVSPNLLVLNYIFFDCIRKKNWIWIYRLFTLGLNQDFSYTISNWVFNLLIIFHFAKFSQLTTRLWFIKKMISRRCTIGRGINK